MPNLLRNFCFNYMWPPTGMQTVRQPVNFSVLTFLFPLFYLNGLCIPDFQRWMRSPPPPRHIFLPPCQECPRYGEKTSPPFLFPIPWASPGSLYSVRCSKLGSRPQRQGSTGGDTTNPGSPPHTLSTRWRHPCWYIPHDNIHEINTRKCLIQTQCG